MMRSPRFALGGLPDWRLPARHKAASGIHANVTFELLSNSQKYHGTSPSDGGANISDRGARPVAPVTPIQRGLTTKRVGLLKHLRRVDGIPPKPPLMRRTRYAALPQGLRDTISRFSGKQRFRSSAWFRNPIGLLMPGHLGWRQLPPLESHGTIR